MDLFIHALSVNESVIIYAIDARGFCGQYRF